MEKSTIASKKRITHIRNSSNIAYDEFSFDLVDSIISESMGDNLPTPIKRQLDKNIFGPLNQLVNKQVQGPSVEPSQSLKTAEAKFKKLTASKKFPLMEKSQKVLKQLKHNRCIPKPRAHLHSTEVSPLKNSDQLPIKPSRKKVKKKGKTKEKVGNNLNFNLYHDKHQNMQSKRSETNSSVLKNIKSNQTSVVQNSSETHAKSKGSVSDKNSDDSTDSEFEKFIEKVKPKKKKPKKKQGKTDVSVKDKSCKLKKVTKCSVTENSFKDSHLRSSKEHKDTNSANLESEHLLTDDRDETSSKEASSKHKKRKLPQQTCSPRRGTDCTELNSCNEMLSMESEVQSNCFEEESIKCDFSTVHSDKEKVISSKTEPLKKKIKLLPKNNDANYSVEECDSNFYDSSVDQNLATINLSNTPEIIDLSDNVETNDSIQNQSNFQEKMHSALSPNSNSNTNFDLRKTPVKVTCLKDTSKLSVEDSDMLLNSLSGSVAGANKDKSLSLQMNQTIDIKKNSLNIYNSPPKIIVAPTHNDHCSSFNDSKLDSPYNAKSVCINKDFIPFDEFCASGFDNVKNTSSIDSDESDLEIIAVVNKESEPSDNMLTPDRDRPSKDSLELNIDQSKVLKNICSVEVNLNSSKSVQCKPEPCTYENNKMEKTISVAEDSSDKHVKQETIEKHDPVYMTNMCQDFTQDEKPKECSFQTSVNSASTLVKGCKPDVLCGNSMKLLNSLSEGDQNMGSEDDVIWIDPNCETGKEKLKQEKQEDDDIIIECEVKVLPKDSLSTSPRATSKPKRKNVLGDVKDISDFPLASKIAKLNNLQISPTSMQKEFDLFTSSPDQLPESNLIVENSTSFEELLTCYKKEFNVYQEILKTEANLEASLRIVETHQANKLEKIRTLIREHVKNDPCFDHISNDSVKQKVQAHVHVHSETVDVAPTTSDHNSNVRQAGDLSDSKSKTMINTVSTSNFPTASIKVENKPLSTSAVSLHHSLPVAAASSDIVSKSDVDIVEASSSYGIPTPEEQEIDFLGQQCAACGKNAVAACQRCAKVFFCSNLCGRRFWIQCHKDVCGK